ncbi:MAG TPA: DUF4142 domain-containing protein, partial [Crenalkalicoccus sp.]|nr:DUF4142 domain-containing protein [Crenalkalicoccus sp.]
MDVVRRLLSTLLATLPFGAAACQGREDPPLDAADIAFIQQATMAGAGMVALGRLAARRSSSPMVRQFAQRIVAERAVVD